jgi:outer membrane protein TolC
LPEQVFDLPGRAESNVAFHLLPRRGHPSSKEGILPFSWGLIILLLLFPGFASAQARSASFSGSVPAGQAANSVLDLSLRDSLDRALKYNLGVIESSQNNRAAQAVRLRALNALLPNLTARVSAQLDQINLRTFGFSLQIPNLPISPIVGPFAVQDARGYLTQEVFNWSDIKSWKSATESERATQYSYKRDRDLVVRTAGGSYLLVISDVATTDSIRARVATAQRLLDNSVDQNRQGVIASIDVLRSRVELQTEQQRLIAAENQLSIDKLALARVIGLPDGQEFRLTDSVPYAPLTDITLDQSLKQARMTRPDYLSAEAQVRAAELARRSAEAENYPSVSVDTNYGVIGNPNFGRSHGTFSLAAGLNIPLFQGSRVRADKLLADSALEQRKAEFADLGGRIDEEVRVAFFNLQSSSELVMVAKSSVDLANQTLTQAQDRFSAGVADNLEVVQAQESVASANQSYIGSSYAFNVSKLALALALGVAEQSALQYLGVK